MPSREVDWRDLQIEQLIDLVKERELIWKKDMDDHKEKPKIADLYNEIDQELGRTGDIPMLP